MTLFLVVVAASGWGLAWRLKWERDRLAKLLDPNVDVCACGHVRSSRYYMPPEAVIPREVLPEVRDFARRVRRGGGVR